MLLALGGQRIPILFAEPRRYLACLRPVLLRRLTASLLKGLTQLRGLELQDFGLPLIKRLLLCQLPTLRLELARLDLEELSLLEGLAIEHADLLRLLQEGTHGEV